MSDVQAIAYRLDAIPSRNTTATLMTARLLEA
jgi:hypothetical protein